MIEENGAKVMDFIRTKIGQFKLIEHFQSFYRFKIETSSSIGKVFGSFEANKTQLQISQYSVKQATIEQIFNMFAEGKVHATDFSNNPENAIKDINNPLMNGKPLSKVGPDVY
jgi:ATP-binding cassette, subfamily A (ABC1), member 3